MAPCLQGNGKYGGKERVSRFSKKERKKERKKKRKKERNGTMSRRKWQVWKERKGK